MTPVLGPDASGVGWGFCYALVDEQGRRDPSELRSLQDYTLKLALESVPGVAQVASLGGFVKQYQVVVDPNRLSAYNIPINRVFEAVRRSNSDIEGRVIEFSGAEYAVRGRGYIRSLEDLEDIPLGADRRGTPVTLRSVARVQLGPEIRRGVADLDGRGEVAGGIVVVRFGENVLNVIDRVKARIERDIAPNLPEGVQVVTTYDRSDLVRQSVDTLRDEILKLTVAVSAVCIVFLYHLPSALVVLLTLPCAIVISFIFLHCLGITSNIMSLSGIAISIGVMVDASIVMVENAHKRLEEWEARGQARKPEGRHHRGGKGSRPIAFLRPPGDHRCLPAGLHPAGPGGKALQAARLRQDLRHAHGLDARRDAHTGSHGPSYPGPHPARARQSPEPRPPAHLRSRGPLQPLLPQKSFAAAVILMAVTVYPAVKIGTEFMPPLYEGSLFYMPVTAPGISISEAMRLLELQDRILMDIPEVGQVFGKAGKGGNGHRPRAARDVRDRDQPQAPIGVAAGHDGRGSHDGDERGPHAARRGQLLHHAHQGPYRHALHRHPDAPGHQDPRDPDLRRSRRIGVDMEKRIKGIPGTALACTPNASTHGYFLDIAVNRKRPPATISPSTT